MEGFPNLNDPVVLRDQGDREYLSRVENRGVELLVVAQPLDLPAGAAVGAGSEFSVIWTDALGVSMSLPTRLLAAHAEGALQLWSLAATGPAVRAQRRQFVRAPVTGAVTLRSATDDTVAISGTLLDLSEAAIRCTIESGAADGFLTSGDEVVAEFGLGAAEFAVHGRAEFLRHTSRPSELEELVVVFSEPVAAGDALRKQIFVEEVQKLRAQGERQGPRDH